MTAKRLALLLPALLIVALVGLSDPDMLTWRHIAALAIGTGIAGAVIESILSDHE